MANGDIISIMTDKRNNSWRSPLLEEMAKCSSLREACRKIGISERTVYRVRRKDPEFAKAFDASVAEFNKDIQRKAKETLKKIPTGGKRLGDSWKRPFLKAFAELGVVGTACKLAGVSRPTVIAHRKKDPEFAKAFDDAFETAIDKHEEIVFNASLEAKDVASAKWVLSKRRPSVYGERVEIKQEVVGDNSITIEFVEESIDGK